MAGAPLPENVTEADDWRDVFGHDEPYPEQADGIDAAVDRVRRLA